MRLLFYFLLSVLSSVSFGQSDLDELYSIWTNEEASDSSRLKALDDYIWDGFLYSNPDSAFNLALVQYVMAKRSSNDEQIGNALSNLGQSQLFSGNYDQAEQYAKKNLKFTKEVNDTLGLPRAYNLLGMVYNDRMDFDQSKIYFDSCIVTAKKQGQIDLLTQVYHNIGVLYNKFSYFDKAIESYQLSLKIEESRGNMRGVGMTTKQIANVYFQMGKFSAAYEIYLDILDVCEKAGNLPDLYAETCSDLGNLLHQQGDYEKSAFYYLKSIATAKEHGYVITEAIASVNLGTNYNENKKYTDALKHFRSALKIFREVDHHYGEGVSLTNIGEVNTALKDYDTAAVYLNRGLEIFLDMDNQYGISSSYNYLAHLHEAKGSFDKSIEFANRSLAISKKYQLHDQRGMSYEVLLSAYRKNEDVENCLAILNEMKAYRDRDLAVNYFTMSEIQKDLYFRTLEQAYHNYYAFSLANKKEYPQLVDTSLNIALQTKGLSLKSTTALRKEILNSGNQEVKDLYEELIKTKENVAKKYAQGEAVDSLESIVNILERKLIEVSNSFSSFDKVRSINWKSLQRELKRGEVIVEYVHFKEPESETVRYVAFILKNYGAPQMIPICTEKELVQLLDKGEKSDLDFVNDLYTIKNGENALFNLIIKPFYPFIEKSKSIFIAPSGLLHKVSFAALPLSNDQLFMCQRFDINQNNSSSVMLDRAELQLEDPDRFLVIGGVQYSSKDTKQEIWSYLPGSMQETNTITAHLSQSNRNVTFLSAYDATEENFKSKATESEFVHVATHGFFFPDPSLVKSELTSTEVVEEVNFRGATNYARWSFVENKNPLMRSGITFSYANDVWGRSTKDLSEDGVFTAKEAAGMDFSKTKLMVLSACETGLGDIKGSEGVYGLQRSLKLAGVEKLVMSLWQVPDKETSEFMELFYQQLIQSNSVELAFNYARKTMSLKYEPYYWGAFILIE